MSVQTWSLWIPDAASRGISFALAALEPADGVLVHSPPTLLRVEIRDSEGGLVASGDNLKRTADSPMARLHVAGSRVLREDAWPQREDEGALVILPGGEVGTLRSWWNAADQSEWRWTVEFYNHR